MENVIIKRVFLQIHTSGCVEFITSRLASNVVKCHLDAFVYFLRIDSYAVLSFINVNSRHGKYKVRHEVKSKLRLETDSV